MIIEVELGAHAYPIHLVGGGLEGLGVALGQRRPAGRCFLVSPPPVAKLYAEAATKSLVAAGFDPQFVGIPDGEGAKSLAVWGALVEGLIARGADRQTPVLALGGGVTGDLAGFAAATTLRGLPFVQVPTTLLAMVDSAVGGKTGVNTQAGKNLVGAFYQPELVYAAMGTLTTLPPEELRSGLGEVVKHALIGDVVLFGVLLHNAEQVRRADPAILAALVEASCHLKATIVAQDEREEGLRAVLNLGHTAGHALETALGHGRLRHGECVALGLQAEVRWAAERGSCGADLPAMLRQLLDALGLHTRCPPVPSARLHAALGRDKKRARGTIHTAIVEAIGRVRLERVPFSEADRMLDLLFEPTEP